MTRVAWELRNADEQAAKLLANSGIHPVIARLLVARGIKSAEEARSFLNPSLDQLLPSKGLPDIDEASEIIVRAIRDKKRVCIYGDFDADGITSTALAIEFFRALGVTCNYYIPDRQQEGYGLSRDGIKKVADLSTNLLITADCGTTNAEELDYACSLGIDVIVTDHHQPLDMSPGCPFVNPQLQRCEYPFKDLAGVGVMLYVLGAVRKRLIRENIFSPSEVPDLRNSLDLVAIGTIADVVPLTGENRILAHYGLGLLTNSQRPGIVALKEVSDLNDRRISAYHVAFMLAPRVNAAGRLESANLAVKLLLTQSPSEAIRLARQLNDLNSQRQSIETKILEEAKSIIAEDPDWESKRSIVVAREGWHTGVIGIVASRLSQEYYKPVFLISLDGDMGRGSGRSIPEVNLMQALSAHPELLETFGGHSQAAGLTIRRNNVFDFAQAFENAIKEQLGDYIPGPVLRIDAYPKPEEITVELAKELDLLEPTGFGNPEPTLAIKNCLIESKELRRERHLKMVVNLDKFRFEALWWNHGHLINRIGRYADIAFVPEIDKFWGKELVRWKVRAIKSATEG